MHSEALYGRSRSLADAEDWLALGAGALLLLVGASRRSTVGCLSRGVIRAAAVPRHHWPLAGCSERRFPARQHQERPGRRIVASTSGNRFGSRCRSPTSTGSGVASKICRSS